MKLPAEIIAMLENETSHLEHGIVTLTLHVRDAKLARYIVAREISIIPATPGAESRGAPK